MKQIALYDLKTKKILSIHSAMEMYPSWYATMCDQHKVENGKLGTAKLSMWYGAGPRWAQAKQVWIDHATKIPVRLK